jgi:hypothetical protein
MVWIPIHDYITVVRAFTIGGWVSAGGFQEKTPSPKPPRGVLYSGVVLGKTDKNTAVETKQAN